MKKICLTRKRMNFLGVVGLFSLPSLLLYVLSVMMSMYQFVIIKSIRAILTVKKNRTRTKTHPNLRVMEIKHKRTKGPDPVRKWP